MSEQELVENLGTIAKSGTQAFVEKAKAKQGDVHLIGQFGIGFYSGFIVASKVDVISRRAGSDEAFMWSSDGSGSFTVAPVGAGAARHRDRAAPQGRCAGIPRGLEDRKRGAHLFRPHRAPDHAGGRQRDGAPDQQRQRHLDAARSPTSRPEQHKEFFGHISGSYSDPAITLHYRAEGRHEYTVLLYVPGERPFDLYDPERRGRQKLYVKRVYIADDVEMLPAYLRFVRGVIDSEDMPLNISREMLQNNPQVAAIRKAVTNKVLSRAEESGGERRGDLRARSGTSSARCSRKASMRTWSAATSSMRSPASAPPRATSSASRTMSPA